MLSPKELQAKRLSFLHCLYDLTSADRTNSVKLEEIIQKSGITHSDAISIGQYLHDEKLIGHLFFPKSKKSTVLKYVGMFNAQDLDSYRHLWNPKRPISITHKGIKEIDQTLNNPDKSTEHFQSITNNNYINNSGIIASPSIQQNIGNSNQTTINNIQRNELQQIINQIKESVDNERLTLEQKQILELEVATLELQSKSPRPMIQRIKESLLSVKEILDTISTGAIVITKITTWIAGLQSGLGMPL